MKTRKVATPPPGLREKIVRLKRQISLARIHAEKTRTVADRAKIELKRVRKTFKAAKRAAKEARKKVKAWKKVLAAAIQVPAPKAETPAASGKSSLKIRSTPRAKSKAPKKKPVPPAELGNAADAPGEPRLAEVNPAPEAAITEAAPPFPSA